jgi:hypothetical protein
MNLSHIFEKLGRTIFEEPFNAGGRQEPPEVAEIRFALLDEVRKKSYRSGGKRVFPYNFVHIYVRGVEDSRSRIFKADFFKKYFEQEVRKSLVKAECKYPEDLEVAVSVSRPRGDLALDRNRNAKAPPQGAGAPRGEADRDRRQGQPERRTAGEEAHQHRPHYQRLPQRRPLPPQ